jgi:hypothetical protein
LKHSFIVLLSELVVQANRLYWVYVNISTLYISIYCCSQLVKAVVRIRSASLRLFAFDKIWTLDTV